jgi:hypothetical protein
MWSRRPAFAAKSNFGAINELNDLIDQYYMYLPKKILIDSQSLYQLFLSLCKIRPNRTPHSGAN